MTSIPEPTPRRYCSASALERWEFCPTSYWLRYVQRLVATGHAPALVQGTGMHIVGDHYRRGNPLPMALLAVASDLPAKHPTVTDADLQRITCLATAYYQRWQEPITTAHNEVSLKLHLGNAWWFRGWCDAVAFDLHGSAPLVYEMKTTSATCDEMEQVLRQAPQIWLYMEMLKRQYGLEVRGAMLDIIKKPWSDDKEGGGVVRPRKGEASDAYLVRCGDAMLADPDRYFRRVVVDYDGSRIEYAVDALKRAARGIERAESEGFGAIRGYRCRTPYGIWCEYRDYCWYGNASKYRTEEKGKFDGQTDNDGKQRDDDADTAGRRVGEHGGAAGHEHSEAAGGAAAVP